MALDVYVRLVSKLAPQSGEGKNGPWNKQDFVTETIGDYPKKICFSAWNERADALKNFTEGSLIKVSFNPESREFNGKWYTDLRCWKIEIPDAASGGDQYANSQPSPNTGANTQAQTPPPASAPTQPTENADLGGSQEDDLPF